MKHLFPFVIFTFSLSLLAGCAPKSVEIEPLSFVKNDQRQSSSNALQYKDNQNQGDLELPGSKKMNPAVPTSSPNQTSTEENTVKTLKDFKPMAATQATIKTNKGDVVIELYPDKTPLTVTNFLTLAKSNFYDGIKFHRIIADFMAQVGDPKTKDDSQKAAWGTGGPGYTILDEFDPSLNFAAEGVVAMANTGQPSTGGSQFFITYGDTSWLNGKHTIFGKVTKGMEVVKKLEIGDQILSISF